MTLGSEATIVGPSRGHNSSSPGTTRDAQLILCQSSVTPYTVRADGNKRGWSIRTRHFSVQLTHNPILGSGASDYLLFSMRSSIVFKMQVNHI